MAERWEGDERGRGVGDAAWLLDGAGELTAAMALPGWVAEQPEVHLSPHLRTWLDHQDALTLDGVELDDGGAYVVDLTWQGRLGDLRGVRAAAYALIGQVAESASYVRQRREEMSARGPLLLGASQGLAIDGDSVLALCTAKRLPQESLSPGPDLGF